MTAIIEQLWAMSYWDLTKVWMTIQWITLVKYWWLWAAIIAGGILYVWWEGR